MGDCWGDADGLLAAAICTTPPMRPPLCARAERPTTVHAAVHIPIATTSPTAVRRNLLMINVVTSPAGRHIALVELIVVVAAATCRRNTPLPTEVVGAAAALASEEGGTHLGACGLYGLCPALWSIED